jgi:hypothetical protein
MFLSQLRLQVLHLHYHTPICMTSASAGAAATVIAGWHEKPS